ncbi:hypothetical protein AN286_09430 [Aliarcobacter cryaerophilus ATCC 43158]|uniref:Lipoprotein n=1 Tax=Aliarcobacter cryaerophilus ATCC 43158 TaxID=1032070 RepID=A0AAD0XAG8_9BACT|nr:hypothetical protein [Aliarcobacter cryaerophilus]AYJ80392.1 hypothetical protein ACRYA_1266 [Aliarcobacter cryaerophilus ATCC 43158]PRM98802.1 hypothetical protein CJ667_01890 [Aliarcobacter cryaerophilus]QCZ24603.1 hypothetical protein AN286_09430 [Aliarcobacter cryaerophilus ATCC 43158]
MTNIFKILLIGLIGVFILTGCRTGATVYNVPTSDISVKKGTTEDQVFKAIRTAGTQLGWIITKVKPGLAEGQLNLRGHSATVEIPYNRTSYAINYKNSSSGLKYDSAKQTIHPNYNGWVQNLNNAIRVQLNNLED